jgi:class 3 adenylate cyclase
LPFKSQDVIMPVKDPARGPSVLEEHEACYLVAPEPVDEAQRIEALRRLNLLDSPAEERFDHLVELAAQTFKVPICYVALVDTGRQWFKSKIGLDADQTSRKVSFCSHTILQSTPLIIPDTRADERYAQNPLVVEDPHIRFYAGQSLRDPSGYRVGTLCVADRSPRSFNNESVDILQRMAKLVERELSMRNVIRMQEETLRLQQVIVENEKELKRLNAEISSERDKSEALLLNTLPAGVVRQLKEHGSYQAREFRDACVMFTDFTDFTRISESLTPGDLVRELNECFSVFDQITIRNNVERLKTLGDGYLAVSGMPAPTGTEVADMARAALEICDFVRERQEKFAAQGRKYWNVRIGLHRGALVGGVAGIKRFAFDIWGDTVNTASRLESASEPGRVNMSAEFRHALPPNAACESRGEVEVKSKGKMEMFFLQSIGKQ